MESDSSSSSEGENSPDKGEKNSIAYDSDSNNSDKSSNNATDTEEEAWKMGCRDGFVIDKLNNSKSNIKEHKLSSNNLDKALHDDHLLNNLRKPSKMVKQTKSKKKLKHVHFSPIIFVKMVIYRRQEGQTVQDSTGQALVDSWAS